MRLNRLDAESVPDQQGLHAAARLAEDAFETAVPFGLNSRQHVAWWMHGGGRQLMDEFYKDYGVVGHMMGGTGAQMAAGTARRSRRSTT